ncbi:MAG TPA: DNA translocase FtsK 4TM domain-containing protein [Chloroflexota bacterium]|nr:DNA translocase FtsK 4TM domain-containing protein [Chloroflexota bacterium]
MEKTLPSQTTLHLTAQAPDDLDARTSERIGPLLLLLAACLAIIVFLPPEGRVSVPLHDALEALLGRAAFVLPVGFALGGALLLAHALRPDVVLPRRRLIGVGILLLAVLTSEHLLGGERSGTGLVGEWLARLTLDLLGSAVTVLLLVTALIVGTLMAFDIHPRLPVLKPQPTTQAEPHAES